MWSEPIFNRTQSDIGNKKSKAFCNVVDLQRMDGNCKWLADLLGAVIDERNEWQVSDFLEWLESERILGNINQLRAAYYVRPDTPDTPDSPLNAWPKWNAAEKILNDLYELYVGNLASRWFAGEGYSGETIGVI